jgi:hypothetical protein
VVAQDSKEGSGAATRSSEDEQHLPRFHNAKAVFQYYFCLLWSPRRFDFTDDVELRQNRVGKTGITALTCDCEGIPLQAKSTEWEATFG